MSWAEAPVRKSTDGRLRAAICRGRSAVSVAVLVTAALTPLLAACGDGGFRPLYGSAAIGGANVSERLAQVEVAPVPGRVGQRMRNDLIFHTTGGGHALPPEYRLEIAIRESITSTLVKVSGDASGSVYNLDADFRLIRIADKQVVLQGKSASRAGFERFTSVFSNVRARRDAENRAATTIGRDLKTRLATYLARPV